MGPLPLRPCHPHPPTQPLQMEGVSKLSKFEALILFAIVERVTSCFVTEKLSVIYRFFFIDLVRNFQKHREGNRQ
jgi:hypothetical protein